MNFGEALEHLKQGKKIRRSIWGGYWELHYNVHLNSDGDRVDQKKERHLDQLIVAVLRDNKGIAPAQTYQEDILAEDWLIVE
jgi:hypothetical protein